MKWVEIRRNGKVSVLKKEKFRSSALFSIQMGNRELLRTKDELVALVRYHQAVQLTLSKDTCCKMLSSLESINHFWKLLGKNVKETREEFDDFSCTFMMVNPKTKTAHYTNDFKTFDDWDALTITNKDYWKIGV